MKITKRKLLKIIREQLELEVIPLQVDVESPKKMGDGGPAKMVKAQLFQVAKDAQSLNDKLSEEDELPEWVQSKVAVMSDNMSAVADYLQYKIHKHDNNG